MRRSVRLNVGKYILKLQVFTFYTDANNIVVIEIHSKTKLLRHSISVL